MPNCLLDPSPRDPSKEVLIVFKSLNELLDQSHFVSSREDVCTVKALVNKASEISLIWDKALFQKGLVPAYQDNSHANIPDIERGNGISTISTCYSC